MVQAASDNLCVLSKAQKIQAAYNLAPKCGLEYVVEGESIIGYQLRGAGPSTARGYTGRRSARRFCS